MVNQGRRAPLRFALAPLSYFAPSALRSQNLIAVNRWGVGVGDEAHATARFVFV